MWRDLSAPSVVASNCLAARIWLGKNCNMITPKNFDIWMVVPCHRTFMAMLLVSSKERRICSGTTFDVIGLSPSRVSRDPSQNKSLLLASIGCLFFTTWPVKYTSKHDGHAKVFKQSFWMRGWGSRTPKRTTLWANSTAIRFFSTTEKALGLNRKGSYKLADTYTDALGRKRFKGNKRLRKSQNLALFNPCMQACTAMSFDAIWCHVSLDWSKGIPLWLWSSLCPSRQAFKEGAIQVD